MKETHSHLRAKTRVPAVGLVGAALAIAGALTAAHAQPAGHGTPVVVCSAEFGSRIRDGDGKPVRVFVAQQHAARSAAPVRIGAAVAAAPGFLLPDPWRHDNADTPSGPLRLPASTRVQFSSPRCLRRRTFPLHSHAPTSSR